MKAILWDWNGVIIDDLDAVGRANCEIIKLLSGNDVKVKTWFKEVRQDWHQFFLSKGVKIEDIPKVLPLMDEHYTKYIDLIKFPKNTKEVLEKLGKKYKMGILSGADRSSIQKGLKRYKIDHLFEFVISGQDVVKEKPHPEGLLKAIELFKISPKEIIYVDDMPIIFKQAKELGFTIIGFKSRISHGTMEEADFLVDNFKDLEKVVDRL